MIHGFLQLRAFQALGELCSCFARPFIHGPLLGRVLKAAARTRPDDEHMP